MFDEKEVWKPIAGYGGKYEVSNLGNVRSFSRKGYTGGKPLKLRVGKAGYAMVALSNGRERRVQLVHRLVAFAFVENPNNYPQVNHRDENRQNNRADNLEWCTAVYNLAYNDGHMRRGRTRSKPCVAVYRNGEVKRFVSTCQAERETGVYHGHIAQVCNGKGKTAGGAQWKWDESA